MRNTTRLKMWKNERYAHDAACRGLSTRTNGRSLGPSAGLVALAELPQSKRESFVASRGTALLQPIWSPRLTNLARNFFPEKEFAGTVIAC
jgi:hypothetical protein